MDETKVVKLNIGGKRFVTTAETLTQRSQTGFFALLLAGRIPSTKVDDDHWFVDRNGRYFEPLLDYLRTGIWQLPGHLEKDERLVLVEADFYGIEVRAQGPHLGPPGPVSDKTLQQRAEEVKACAPH
jgi:hypothetical protein